MYPYPRSYPSEAVQLVADHLSGHGDNIEKKDVIHACWVISGYTLSKIFGGGPEVIGSRRAKPAVTALSEERQKELFAGLAKANRYNTFNKLEEANPDCWKELYSIAAKTMYGK
jgi:hypothetical protein